MDLSLGEDFLQENDIKERKSIEFEWKGVEKNGDSNAPWNPPDTVKLEFPVPWKIRNVDE